MRVSLSGRLSSEDWCVHALLFYACACFGASCLRRLVPLARRARRCIASLSPPPVPSPRLELVLALAYTTDTQIPRPRHGNRVRRLPRSAQRPLLDLAHLFPPRCARCARSASCAPHRLVPSSSFVFRTLHHTHPTRPCSSAAPTRPGLGPHPYLAALCRRCRASGAPVL